MTSSEFVVHIVDDEELVRNAVSFFLKSAGFKVQLHESPQSFLDLAPTLRDSCLLVDLKMPEIDGLEMLLKLIELDVHIPAIMISGHGNVPAAVKAMKLGALDFIEKPFRAEALVDAVMRARAELKQQSRKLDPAPILQRYQTLTAREKDVLGGVIDGASNKMIAFKFNISARTVEIHRAAVMHKMQARTLPELVRACIAAGLLPD